MARCDICGKGGMMRWALSCSTCGTAVCRHHEKEQFVATSVSPDSELPLGSSTMFNYPDGKSFPAGEFRCYKCRTGREPADRAGAVRKDFVLLLQIYTLASFLIMAILAFYAPTEYLLYFILPDAIIMGLLLAYDLRGRKAA